MENNDGKSKQFIYFKCCFKNLHKLIILQGLISSNFRPREVIVKETLMKNFRKRRFP